MATCSTTCDDGGRGRGREGGRPITSSRLWDQRRISGVKQDQIIHLFKDRNGIEYIYYTRN